MAPSVEAFPPSQLATRVQYVSNGRKRKQPVDIKDCELKELLQYKCDLNGPVNDRRSKVECEPIMRLFRKCSNGLTIETTSWKGDENM